MNQQLALHHFGLFLSLSLLANRIMSRRVYNSTVRQLISLSRMRIEEEHGYISGRPVVKVTRESINGHKFDTARRTSLRGKKNVEMTRRTPLATFLFFQKRQTTCRLFLTKEKSITIDRNGGGKQTKNKLDKSFPCFLFYFSCIWPIPLAGRFRLVRNRSRRAHP